MKMLWILCSLSLISCGRQTAAPDPSLQKNEQLAYVAEQYGQRLTDLQAQAYASIRPASGDRASISIRLNIDTLGNCRIRVDKAVAIIDGVWAHDNTFTLLLLREKIALIDQAESLNTDLSNGLLPLLLRQIPTLIEQLQYGPVPPREPDLWQDNQPVWNGPGSWSSTLNHQRGMVKERRWKDATQQTLLHARYSDELVRESLRTPQQCRLSWHDGSTARATMRS